MGSSLKLTREDYVSGLEQVDLAYEEGTPYLDRFVIEFPDGLNTAGALEICRAIQDPSMASKEKLMRLCIKGKNVVVTCPNGEVEKFCISEADDILESFPLFQKEPLALIAIEDSIYGYILKKSLRLSNKPKGAAGTQKTV